jgi:plastocyanin
MNTHRGWPWASTLLIVAVLFVPSIRARAATTTVIERGSQYVPAQVDVTVGDTVTWIYESSSDPRGHTVTFNDKDLNDRCPGLLGLDNNCQSSPSQRVSRTFTSAGTYAYRCKLVSGMTGVVVVNAAGVSTSSTVGSGSSTTATVKASTTTTKATSSTTSTTRVLSTSSTVIKSSTTTSDTSSALQPGEAPPFSSDDPKNNAAGKTGGSSGGSDSGTVALIVGALLAVSAGGGYLVWRLRPGRG